MTQRDRPLRVYLVEDSFIMGNLLEELIAAIDATVVGRSGSAATAIKEVAVLDPDVVVIDLALPEGNGFEVLEATRPTSPGKRPTRIVLTNHATPAYRNAAVRLDVDQYFDKSQEITKMIEFLARL